MQQLRFVLSFAALLFDGVGFFDVGLAVMTRNWAFLLKHLILLDGELESLPPCEKIRLLQSRLSPIERSGPDKG